MGKIIQITEAQYKKLILAESTQSVERDFIARNIDVEFEVLEKNIDGRYVYGVVPQQINVAFNLNVKYRSHGIDDIQLTDIMGPTQMDVTIEMEPTSDDSNDEEVEHTIKLDWSNIEVSFEDCDSTLALGIERVLVVLDSGFFVDKIYVYPTCKN
jgi:hypothetical protein